MSSGTKNVGAVRAVKRRTPESEWALFFDMLGLANGDRVAPDDERTYTNLGQANPKVGGRNTFRDGPEVSTAPDSLQNLPPVVVPPKPIAKPKPKRAPRTRTPVSPREHVKGGCGTRDGYRQHKLNDEPACEPCDRAHTEHVTNFRKTHPPAPCGTPGGHARHRRDGETVCDPCREAMAADANERRRARLAKQRGAEVPHRPKPTCGTPGGYSAHYKNGTKPCDVCKAAENPRRAAYRATKRAQKEQTA